VRIGRDLLDEIVAHARDEAPNECCGVLVGDGDAVSSLVRTTNVFASPVRFEIGSDELYAAWKAAQDAGEDVAGFYHSHVKAPAYPSQTDVNWAANWPGVVHVICSLGGEEPATKAFRIEDGRIEEVELDE
jgi:proteasome lid subunit RPN8/RPN11